MSIHHTTSTTLLDIRQFLSAHGRVVPARSGTDAPLQALGDLLAERRGDEVFWHQLASLTRRLEDS